MDGILCMPSIIHMFLLGLLYFYVACAKQCDPSVSGGKLYGGNKNKLGIRRRRQAYRGGVSSPVGTAM